MRQPWRILLGYLMLGVAFAVGFWLVEALLHSLWFDPGPFASGLWPQTHNELWMRSFISLLFIILGCVSGVLNYRLVKQRDELLLNRRAFDGMQECVLITNRENRIVYVNPAYTSVTGYSADEVLGKNPNISGSDKQNKQFYQAMWATLQERGCWQGEMWNRKKTGEFYPEWLSITTLYNDEGSAEYYIGIFTNITERKKTEALMKRYALYDSLTDLPNRRFFYERLSQAMRYARRNQQQLAVMFLDLDHFKCINDEYGHDAGDQYLKEFSTCVQKVLRDVDTLSRFGGDEFVVLLTNVSDKASARLVAEKILAIDSVLVDDINLSVSCSIGVAMYPVDAVDSSELIEKADRSMYQAKQRGRDGVNFIGD